MNRKSRERVIDSMLHAMLSALKEEGFDYSNLALLKIDANVREFRAMMDVVLETTSVDTRTVISCFLDRLVKQ